MLFLFQVTPLPDLKTRMLLNSKFKFSQFSRFLVRFHWTCFAHACWQQWNWLKSWFIFPREYRPIICTLQSLFPLACCPWDKGKSSTTSAENPTCLIWAWTDDDISLTRLEFSHPSGISYANIQWLVAAGDKSWKTTSKAFLWVPVLPVCWQFHLHLEFWRDAEWLLLAGLTQSRSDMCVAEVLRSQLFPLATTFYSKEPWKMPRQIRPSFRVSPAS